MNTLDIEVRVMNYMNIRKNLVVPNISWGLDLHECDILSLSPAGYATEIEIKISASDLRADFKKKHNHKSDKITYLYYAVPDKLTDLALELIPETAGLLVCYWNTNKDIIFIRQERSPKRSKTSRTFTEKERYTLARLGSMRILSLKQSLNNCKKIISLQKQ